MSCTAGRRPSLLATLAQELGPKQDSNNSVSPVLEQTSVADFIRVLSSLQSKLENNEYNIDNSFSNNSAKLINNHSVRSSLRRTKSKKELFRSTSALAFQEQVSNSFIYNYFISTNRFILKLNLINVSKRKKRHKFFFKFC